MCQILGHLQTVNFPFWTNGKLTIFKCPNTKHITVHLLIFTLKITISEGTAESQHLCFHGRAYPR